MLGCRVSGIWAFGCEVKVDLDQVGRVLVRLAGSGSYRGLDGLGVKVEGVLEPHVSNLTDPG